MSTPNGQTGEKMFGMFLQDSMSSDLFGNHVLQLNSDYVNWMGTSRFLISDVDLFGSQVFPETDWNRARDLSFEFFFRTNSLQSPLFHQVNVFAVAAQTLDFVEKEVGKNFTWRSGAPLILRPHAFQGVNSFFDPGQQAINFGWYSGPGLSVWTCLSHDVIAHELAHAIMDSLRPFLAFATDLDSRAVLESLADLVAMFSVLEHKPVVEQLYRQTGGSMRIPNLVSELGIAAPIGGIMKPMPLLRSAITDETLYNPFNLTDVHSRSTKLTAAIYEILSRLVAAQDAKSQAEFHDAIVEATRWLMGIIIRTFSYMPPARITVRMLTRLLYEADARVFPQDSHFRDLAKTVFEERGLWDERITFSAPDIGDEVRDASTISPSDLAHVVMAHAKELGIPNGYGVRVLTPTLTTTNREIDRVKNKLTNKPELVAITEHYLSYIYETRSSSWQMAGLNARFGGGTLAFDKNWNAILLAKL